MNQKEIILPDAEIVSDSKDICVLIIGESARSRNFSLYGYRRNTNPLLAGDSVKTYIANSHDTYTTAGVKAILDHKETDELYEILPNYLFRNGVDVVWRSANWGEPPLHIEKYKNHKDLAEKYPEADGRYDGVLIAGLIEEIENNEKDKQLIVLHTSTSHGPTYYQKYPEEFEVFTPVCTTVEMAKVDRAELVNAYDNTILYTDYLLHSVIELLRDVEDRRCVMIYLSDHGESLGEGNVYMHGMVSASMAPSEQIDIPFIVWQGADGRELKRLDSVGHYHIFHSVMDFLDLRSDIYDEEYSIFE
jgi:lipid A ethanolaminephosphotransferase